MNMRIDSNQGGQVSENNRADAGPQTASFSSSSASGVLTEDLPQLSGAHVLVQVLAAQASQLPEVRHEKVNALRQAVQSGNYRPHSEKVAIALFSHLLAAPAA
jgi:flagellar biosynthesis anti-sigma factor FlgM